VAPSCTDPRNPSGACSIERTKRRAEDPIEPDSPRIVLIMRVLNRNSNEADSGNWRK